MLRSMLEADMHMRPSKQLQPTPDACAYVQMWHFHSNQVSILTQQNSLLSPPLHQISQQDPDRAQPGAATGSVLLIHHGSAPEAACLMNGCAMSCQDVAPNQTSLLHYDAAW